MRSVLRIFLSMLLLVGLVSTPVLAGMTAAQAGVRCQHATQKQRAVGKPVSSAKKSPCTCLVDHCNSMDDGYCQHSPAPSFTALLADTIKLSAVRHDHQVTVFLDSHAGLSIPPESPPPIV